MRVHFIDVGQGAATLFEFADGAVLVDTGGEENASVHSDAMLDPYLDVFFERRPERKRSQRRCTDN
jgi:competence protein ComEC